MLSLTNTLKAGAPYTLTFSNGAFLNFAADSSVEADLAQRLSALGMGRVTEVSRAAFSDRYAVTILPAVTMPLRDMVEAFGFVWPQVGFPQATFLFAEGGVESSQPGGMAELLPEVGEKIGETVTATLSATMRPLLPLLVVGGILVVLVLFWPRIAAGRA